MSFGRRIRNIAVTQLNAMKERLDRIDAEAAEAAERYEGDARAELNDRLDIRPVMRTPEEIASGAPRTAARPSAATSGQPAAAPEQSAPLSPPNPLSVHYKRLGVEDGADFRTVQAAYSKLAARCAPERFAEGSEERNTVLEIRKRVDASYDALRDALDPTAGRFDKLEL
jgi:hypothetical protein